MCLELPLSSQHGPCGDTKFRVSQANDICSLMGSSLGVPLFDAFRTHFIHQEVTKIKASCLLHSTMRLLI